MRFLIRRAEAWKVFFARHEFQGETQFLRTIKEGMSGGLGTHNEGEGRRRSLVDKRSWPRG